MAEERLQKILARAGIASRRNAEALISAGRVSVDGRKVTELGAKADPRASRIEVDGRRLVAEPLVYVVLHKPRAVVSTLSDPEGRRTVADLVRDVPARVAPVGRLDYHTSGALLMTNDGEFASRIAHPRLGAPKVYVAKVKGEVKDADLERWTESITIEGRATRPAEVTRLRYEGDKTWLEITLREGRNRQVRRLGERSGFPVMRLARLSHAGISSEGLRPGEWRYLTSDELTDLKQAFGVPHRVRAAPAPPIAKGRPQLRQRAVKGAGAKPGRAPQGVRSTHPAPVGRPGRGAQGARSTHPAPVGRPGRAAQGARSTHPAPVGRPGRAPQATRAGRPPPVARSARSGQKQQPPAGEARGRSSAKARARTNRR